MRIALMTAASAVALTVGGASAATLDLTAASPSNTGTLAGVGYAVTALGGVLDNSQSFDGDGTPAGDLAADLAFVTDGYGVSGDEITLRNGVSQAIVITFDAIVRLTGVAFLDLFNDEGQANDHNSNTNDNGTSDEFAELLVDGTSVAVFDSTCPINSNPDCGGYLEAVDLSFAGSVFTFVVGQGETQNDGVGDPDYALAAIEVAAVPVPAAGLLLLGALGGLGAAARRKRRDA